MKTFLYIVIAFYFFAGNIVYGEYEISSDDKKTIDMVLGEYFEDISLDSRFDKVQKLENLKSALNVYKDTENIDAYMYIDHLIDIQFQLTESFIDIHKIHEVEELYGDMYYDFSGYKGLVLCFHGHGGSAAGWEIGDNKEYVHAMKKEGYSFLCPTSVDRENKKWSNIDTNKNIDVQNIDSFLDELGIDKSIPLYVVGHSNGGGFVSRFSVFSDRKESIHAVQYSNSSGLVPVLKHSLYEYPTAFMYSRCDSVVDVSRVEDSIDILLSKIPTEHVSQNELTYEYENGIYRTCHEFMDTSDIFIDFIQGL